MSRVAGQAPEVETAVRSRELWLVPIFLALALFLLFNLDGSLMHDDEGAAFYEVWRLQQGEEPGVDFIAENQPLFLITGRAIIDVAGRSPLALRLLPALTLLLGAGALGLAISRLWGLAAGALVMVLVAGNGIVYEQARIFRPDALMLGWEVAGLAAVLVAARRRKRSWWMLSGVCYGVAVLWKLFGLFPVLGLSLYFADRLRQEPRRWRRIVADGVAFTVPFLLVSGGLSYFLYEPLGFYYAEAFGYHAAMEGGVSFLARSARNGVVFLLFFWTSPIYLFIWPLWFINRKKRWRQASTIRVLIWQLASLGVFLFITRPLHVRYFLYIVPVLAILLAWQITVTLRQISVRHAAATRFAPLVMAVALAFAVLSSRPAPMNLLLRRENDTEALATYVAQRTVPGEVVISDYATINFLADRPSIYEASIIAGGQIESGVITTDLLIERIESSKARMVLVHVEGGNPFPHHFVRLKEYDRFRRYLTEHFELLTVFDRNGQQIEVYGR